VSVTSSAHDVLKLLLARRLVSLDQAQVRARAGQGAEWGGGREGQGRGIKEADAHRIPTCFLYCLISVVSVPLRLPLQGLLRAVDRAHALHAQVRGLSNPHLGPYLIPLFNMGPRGPPRPARAGTRPI